MMTSGNLKLSIKAEKERNNGPVMVISMNPIKITLPI